MALTAGVHDQRAAQEAALAAAMKLLEEYAKQQAEAAAAAVRGEMNDAVAGVRFFLFGPLILFCFALFVYFVDYSCSPF